MRRLRSGLPCGDPGRPAGDGNPATPEGGFDGSPTYVLVYVPDVDGVIDRAVERGATVTRPAQDQFYGDRDGFIVDPFGHSWLVATHIEDVTPEELQRRMRAMSASH